MPIVRMPCTNPGCGSDLVRDDVTLVNMRTGKPAAVRQWPLQAALLIVCLVALAGVQLVRADAARLVLDIAVVIGFATLSLTSLALLAQSRVVARLVPSTQMHTYTCQICGHQWHSRADATRELPA
ncbi:MAG TPA: hypothetical protein VKT52_04430 [Ktedonobacterales bacterium]|nr:hypothetical protein [Ktedonobacterales bacterium]